MANPFDQFDTAAPSGASPPAQVYSTSTNDGRVRQFTATSQDDLLRQVHAAFPESVQNKVSANPFDQFDAPAPPKTSPANPTRSRFSSAVGGAVDMGTLGFADELGAGVDTAVQRGGDILNGRDGNTAQEYDANLAARRADMAERQQSHPGYFAGGQVAGAVLSPVNKLLAPVKAAGVGNALLAGAKAGAIQGGLYGVGSGAGVEDRLTKGAIGATGGAVVGGALGAAGAKLAGAPTVNALAPDVAQRAEVAAAADRQGIQVLPGDVGNGFVRQATGIAGQSGFAGPMIRAGANKTVASVKDAVDRVTAEIGTPATDQASLGETAQAGARSYMGKAKAVSDSLYTRAEQAAPGAAVTPTKALDAVNAHIDELSQTPETNSAALNALGKIKTDLSNPNGLPLQAARTLKTNARSLISDDLQKSGLDRRLTDVTQALHGDIQDSLASNPKALGAYQTADRYYADRMDTVKNGMSQILGKDGNMPAEKAAQRLTQLGSATGNSSALGKIMDNIPPDARGDVSASILNNLGKPKPGAAGGDFSASEFGTNWNKLQPNAKATLFPDPAHRAALDDIANVVNNGMKQSMKFANHSNSGGAVHGLSQMGAVVSGAAGLASVGLTALGEAGVGSLLGNPAFAKWFAPTIKSATQKELTTRLSVLPSIVAANPDIRPQVQRLMQAVNDNMARSVAAQPNGTLSPNQKTADQGSVLPGQ